VKYDVCFCGNLTLSLPVPTLKVRAGVEMALIDAVANSIRVPLWRLFGGASNTIITDITVKILYNL
jgi:L-alanine-DL-glutamate epimerase-like enolase superfamily enzyme